MAKTTKQETSAEIVCSVDDLLLQILLGLPIRSLLRFKSVSKHWLSLISSPAFPILHRHDPKPRPLGLFLRNQCLARNPEFEFINFDIHNPIRPPFSMVESSKGPLVEAVNIVQSCNGLFLCSVTQVRCQWRKYHLVFNPTTKQSTAIPKPGKRTVQGIAMAFDPAKSPAYKIICILDSDSVPGSFEIKIYSSETRSWRVSGKPFKANHDFKNGVYWNGAIHWLCHWQYDKFMYFNVDEERLGEMPNLYPSECAGCDCTYFGESNGHLHLIGFHHGMPDYELEINEMESDYSRWFVKYRVRLSGLSRAFPKMVQDKRDRYCLLSVLAVIRGEEEEDAFVVLQIPGKAFRYNLADDTFHKLCDFVDGSIEEDKGRMRFHDFCGHQFFESLICV